MSDILRNHAGNYTHRRSEDFAAEVDDRAEPEPQRDQSAEESDQL
ncbi:hypothetical protein P3T36_004881 [Kitasatospora sp. MAP12-15]|nr:hypothetical protein [Kitasatospora sp. MAP12-44]MDH6110187.1 hypothetical protein [Kitasatospora sp. MAP12-44]